MIDVATIGAGGGSIAYIDEGGFFRVGPKSAGAAPGPACYDRGGIEPTVSDANIILGRLGTALLGGRMTIRPELAKNAIMNGIGNKLEKTMEESALGIIDIMNNNMIQEIEKESIRRGLDPREFSLFACGGAGALHACSVARELQMSKVIVPASPGALCAVGLVITDLLYDFSKTEMLLSSKANLERLQNDYLDLEQEAYGRLIEDKIKNQNIVIERVADCRYEGQGYEIRVPVLSGEITLETIEQLKKEFHLAHAKQFGRAFEDNAIEIVNIRVLGIGKIPDLEAKLIEVGNEDASSAITGKRDVVFKYNGAPTKLSSIIYDRGKLKANNVIIGPAIINQMDTTIVVEPNCIANVNKYGIIIIDVK